MRVEKLARLFRQALLGFVLPLKLGDEIVGKQVDILLALAQRWQT
jgi:hypothetical protein